MYTIAGQRQQGSGLGPGQGKLWECWDPALGLHAGCGALSRVMHCSWSLVEGRDGDVVPALESGK